MNREVHSCVHTDCKLADALWHMGLEPDGHTTLKAASAPKFLSDAVPRTWIATDNDPAALPATGRVHSEKTSVNTGKTKNAAIYDAYDPTWDTPADIE